MFPFTVAVGILLRRSETGDRVLSIAQTALGTFGTVFLSLNFLMLAVVGYRPDQPVQVIRPLRDFGFILTFSPVARLRFSTSRSASRYCRTETRARVPAMDGVHQLLGRETVDPGQCHTILQDRPDGVGRHPRFWIPVAVFVAWFVVMFRVTRQAVMR
jgi:hypothetical protein